MRLSFHLLVLLGVGMLLAGCTRVPAGLRPVTGFDSQRYLGKWYEIARLDHSFERGLTNVTAEYAVRPDGSISVVNRGYSPRAGKWRQVRGVARFRGDKTVGSLSVCFFWPFWGGLSRHRPGSEGLRLRYGHGPIAILPLDTVARAEAC